MATREFEHYDGCSRNDPDNCGACALTDTRQNRPNYSSWPLVYMSNRRAIPATWKAAFFEELARTDNLLYRDNLVAHVVKYGARFSDGTTAVERNGLVMHGPEKC